MLFSNTFLCNALIDLLLHPFSESLVQNYFAIRVSRKEAFALALNAHSPVSPSHQEKSCVEEVTLSCSCTVCGDMYGHIIVGLLRKHNTALFFTLLYISLTYCYEPGFSHMLITLNAS